jgi:hypothetical protein
MKLNQLQEAQYQSPPIDISLRVPEDVIRSLFEWADHHNREMTRNQMQTILTEYLKGALYWDDLIEEYIFEYE